MAQDIAFQQVKPDSMLKEEVRQAIRAVDEDILATSYVPKVKDTTTMAAVSFSAQSEMRFERQDTTEKWERQPSLVQANWTRSIKTCDWGDDNEWQRQRRSQDRKKKLYKIE